MGNSTVNCHVQPHKFLFVSKSIGSSACVRRRWIHLMSLPAEIWTQIFGLAADEDILFQPGFPTSLAESAWCRDYWKLRFDVNESSAEWSLRSPEQALDILQRRSYATKKVRCGTYLDIILKSTVLGYHMYL